MQNVEPRSERSLPIPAWPLAIVLAGLAYLSPRPGVSGLLFALAFALVAIHGLRSRQLAGKLRRDAQHLARNVDLLEAAEGLAGYGRWCIELEPRRHLWSEEMCHLAGLPAGTAPREEILERILPDGLAQIETTLKAHERDHEAFAIEFEVADRGGNSRILRARARNLFSPDGVREQVFMVVRDVTGDYSLKRDRDEALERAARAQQQANTDELTGLANRRSAMAFLDRAVVEARKCADPLSVVVFDIDHFKAVNDAHGHLTGDKVIRALGEIALRQARELDLVGRVGGEEFIWIMPGCAADAALRAAERLRWAVEAGTHSAPFPSITISAGHAELEPSDASLTLFARADAALYEAKRAGRNRVTKAA